MNSKDIASALGVDIISIIGTLADVPNVDYRLIVTGRFFVDFIFGA